jgi:hypothetical protein
VTDLIICADWSKQPERRRAWLADPAERLLQHLPGKSWTVEALADEASRRSRSSLIAFDAPIGVPESYLAAALKKAGTHAATFIEWLPNALEHPGFFEPVKNANDWSPDRPFFRVPAGEGALRAFETSAETYGVTLKRRVEQGTPAKSVFATNLPGQVAWAAQALWAELVEARRKQLPIAVWPFDGELGELRARRAVVAAEIYPRAAYGIALSASLPAKLHTIAKTKGHVRVEVIHAFEATAWLQRHSVTIHDRDYALADDGDFDALLTAAALLRLTLESKPLYQFKPDPVAEGAILCA